MPRSASGMNTISKSWPSCVRSSHLRVPSDETCASTTSGREMTKRSANQPRCGLAMSLIARSRRRRDCRSSARPAWREASPGARPGQPPRARRGSASFDRPTSSTRPSARGFTLRGTGTGSITPAIGIKVVSALIARRLSRDRQRILPAPREAQRAAAASIAVGAPSRRYGSAKRTPAVSRASIRIRRQHRVSRR